MDNSEKNINETSLRMDIKNLKYLNKDFVYDFMSVPSVSRYEFRIATYIIMWAKLHNIECKMDDYGNLYLTKGEIKKGEYYPCLTAHMDTVQESQIDYIIKGENLILKTRKNKDRQHEFYCDNFGLGGDDKAGMCIALSAFEKFETLKACFFREEELGNCGSHQLDKGWFENVGYVIGYDSPEYNRAAYKCGGQKLFDSNFFEDHMKEVVMKWGYNSFREEPFTDVREISKQIGIITMNFGTGYYKCHTNDEYCVIEEMDSALGMGIDLINHLGKQRYEFKSDDTWPVNDDEDYYYFKKLDPRYKDFNLSNFKKNFTHTNYILSLMALKTAIEDKCKKLNIDFKKEFEECFNNAFK
jgi:hypothetical protein